MTRYLQPVHPVHMREAQLEAYFRQKVKLSLGGMVVKMAPTKRGIPDRLVLLPGGRVVFVELKARGGKLSVIQQHWHELAAKLGTRVYVVTGREEVDEWVRQVAAEHDPKTRRRKPRVPLDDLQPRALEG